MSKYNEIESRLDNLFPNFEYRDNQRETIVNILNSFINNGNKYVVLDAPTGCFVGNTLVRLFDGSYERIDNLVGKTDFNVISYDNKGNVLPGNVKCVWLTKTTDDLVTVVLKSGIEFTCTKDHKFMCSNGEYVQAQDLRQCQPLMSIPPHISGDYCTSIDYNNFVCKVVEYVGDPLPVYDMEVETYHNFAIAYNDSQSSFIVHNSGKSVIAYQTGAVLNEMFDYDSLFITKTILLQNQYLASFDDMYKMMGSTNYSCHTDFQLPIANSLKFHDNCKYTKSSGKCQYRQAKNKYIKASFKCLNYAFFMTGIEAYKTNGFLVIDEAHNIEEYILDKMEVKFNIRLYDTLNINGIKLSDYWDKHGEYDLESLTVDDIICINKFNECAISSLVNDITILEADALGVVNDTEIIAINDRISKLKKRCNRLQNIMTGFEVVLSYNEFSNWIQYTEEKKSSNFIVLKAVYIEDHIFTNLFACFDKILLMSATALRVKKQLKINADVIISPYTFDIKKRPIYCLGDLPKFNYLTKDAVIGDYVNRIDTIIDLYDKSVNVLIHTSSYANAEYIRKHSKHKKRCKIPQSKDIRNLKNFVKRGNIILSPSMTEGVDMPDGLAKVQIFLKIPYANIGDKWIKAKKNYDSEWYKYKAILDIIQGSGRGIRSKDDEADTYILDPSFSQLYDSMESLIPDWWKQTLHLS